MEEVPADQVQVHQEEVCLVETNHLQGQQPQLHQDQLNNMLPNNSINQCKVVEWDLA